MINPFKTFGDLNKMRQEAVKIQKELEQEKTEIEEEGVKVVINGKQEILELRIDEKEDGRLRKVLNKAIKNSQERAAKKLASLTGGLSGLLGR